ncbi:MAG: nickel pincer cofactor biosynthesis protein LarC [Candidatus Binatia bacterium]
MKILYLDTIAGISGDMTVGALLALGLPIERLRTELASVPIGSYSIDAKRRHTHGFSAVRFDVAVAAQEHAHRRFCDIRDLLERSDLQPTVKHRALAIFTRLAEVEGRVHGVTADAVEFHEVGAVDSIVDIVGTAIGIEWVGCERVYVSRLPLGGGLVRSQHGPLPVPAPATVELLRGFVTRPGDGEGELVTPTGAAIVAGLARPEPVPEFRVLAAGYGAGTRALADRPNVLRAIVGETAVGTDSDEVVVLETNLDDCNPEFYEYVIERLLDAGARDVYLTPVHMKKNRPGIVLTVLCAGADRERLAGIVLSETSAIGVRYHSARRLILARATREVGTPYGAVRVKVAVAPDGHENVAPEYEDCKRLARQRAVPIKLVYQAALAAALATAASARNE